MTTPPRPTTAAVEAALQWVHGSTKAVTGEQLELLHNYYSLPSMGASWNAARILAAEVLHLRCEYGHTNDLLNQIESPCNDHGVGLRYDIREVLSKR